MKRFKLLPRNARFWEYINDGWVKITVPEGQTRRWGKYYRTDDGWSSEGVFYENDGIVVIATNVNQGVDCDGRLSGGCKLFCQLERLQAKPVEVVHPYGDYWYIMPVPLPDWQKIESWQRDYTAESMNY